MSLSARALHAERQTGMKRLTATAYISVCAFAQSFEVASIKPASGAGRVSMRGGPGTDDPSRFTYTNVTLMALVLRAWNVQFYEVSGPSWLDTNRFDLTGTIPPGCTKEQFRAMLRSLLEERFHLVLHRETRELGAWELSAGKQGPRLRETTLPDNAEAGAPRPAVNKDADGFLILDRATVAMTVDNGSAGSVRRLTARAQTLDTLAAILTGELHAPVRDKTGLKGKYDFRLEFAPENPAAGTNTEDAAPPLAAALAEQLGLKLTARKVPTEVLVIDRADKLPTAN